MGYASYGGIRWREGAGGALGCTSGQRALRADPDRSHDAVGRYGGEEFLIVMGGTRGDELKDRAEQVRNAISCLPFSTKHGMIPVSLSLGVTTIEDWDKSLP